jgi:hypothetical protein
MVSFGERSRMVTISYQIGDLADHLPNVGLILPSLHGLFQPDPQKLSNCPSGAVGRDRSRVRFVTRWRQRFDRMLS